MDNSGFFFARFYNITMILLSDFYKSVFGCKAYKISIDAGCTCPNRNGEKSTGGCFFCSEKGSGDFVPSKLKSIFQQTEEGKALVEKKARGRSGRNQVKYIAYFQNFTNTYGNEEELTAKYKEALTCPEVEGLAIATRPDCISDSILEKIAGLAEKHFVQIELGLQTFSDKTKNKLNICYKNADYVDAVKRINSASTKIHLVTHLIFGLPEETEEDMIKSVKFVTEVNGIFSKNSPLQTLPFGIKITSLYVLKNTKLQKLYEAGKYQPLTREEYLRILERAIKLLPENCVVHRLTGDPPKPLLIAPQWTTDKKRLLNEIRKLTTSKTQQFGQHSRNDIEKALKNPAY